MRFEVNSKTELEDYKHTKRLFLLPKIYDITIEIQKDFKLEESKRTLNWIHRLSSTRLQKA
jgi:hypothetical protein